MESPTAAANEGALSSLQLRDPVIVLEVGFGQGRTVQQLVTSGHRVLGVDASRTMVSQARSRNRQAVRDGRATLVHGDGTVIPFGDGSVDAAISVHTVYFMVEPTLVFAEMRRVVRPGGTVAIACNVRDEGVPQWKDPAVFRTPSSADMLSMLTDAGFSEIAVHRVAGTPTDVFVSR
jgi:ubiquinone/menaquinone biosynthesis C-methylase UbiE